MLKRAVVGDTRLTPVEPELDESMAYKSSAEEMTTFVKIMRSFLTLDPAQRPRAAEALLDPVFKDIL